MSSALTIEDPTAAIESPAQRVRRSVRGVAVAVTVASAGIVALAAGSASALPPQCVVYLTNASDQAQDVNLWARQSTDDLDAGDWDALNYDIQRYDAAVRDYNVAAALVRRAGC
jgi:hypothetical protein